jgi:superoxide reductase
MKFYKCKKCGQVMLTINETCEGVTCCGEDITILKAGEVDAAVEKHVPVYELDDNKLMVTVGEVIHPMEEDHFIEFILYEYEGGFDVTKLTPGMEPKASFNYKGKGTLYEYCNKHGLWKKDVE